MATPATARDRIYPVEGPTTVYADNKSAIALAVNPVYHGRSKHIDIQYHYTREKVNDDTIQLLYLPTFRIMPTVHSVHQALHRKMTLPTTWKFPSRSRAELVIRVVPVSGPRAPVPASRVPALHRLGSDELLGTETLSMGRCRAREDVGPVLAQIPGPNLSAAALASPSFVLDL
jgi:hypothetical protein